MIATTMFSHTMMIFNKNHEPVHTFTEETGNHQNHWNTRNILGQSKSCNIMYS